MEEYYECIFNLDNALQHSIDHVLTTFSRLPYFSIFVWLSLKWNQYTLIQHLELICEEKDANGNYIILNVYPTMKVDKKK